MKRLYTLLNGLSSKCCQSIGCSSMPSWKSSTYRSKHLGYLIYFQCTASMMLCHVCIFGSKPVTYRILWHWCWSPAARSCQPIVPPQRCFILVRIGPNSGEFDRPAFLSMCIHLHPLMQTWRSWNPHFTVPESFAIFLNSGLAGLRCLALSNQQSGIKSCTCLDFFATMLSDAQATQAVYYTPIGEGIIRVSVSGFKQSTINAWFLKYFGGNPTCCSFSLATSMQLTLGLPNFWVSRFLGVLSEELNTKKRQLDPISFRRCTV